jgi:uncharacterized protein (DUF983 family)
MSEVASMPTPDVKTSGFVAMRRGLVGRCPACGEGRLFGRYLKVAESCGSCGMPFHHHRADDFPPYIVMFIVGHVVGYGIYASETGTADIPIWIHVAIWPALTLLLSLALLQPIKGAVVGLQYGLRMHGFAEAVRSRSARIATADREDVGERGQGACAGGPHDERGARETLAEPKT